MSELLNQPQLEHAIDEILYGKHEQPYSKGDALLMLINTQKRLYAESVIGEDERPALEASPLMKYLSPNTNRIDWRNELRAEQRARIK